jgi:hypothetical protein
MAPAGHRRRRRRGDMGDMQSGVAQLGGSIWAAASCSLGQFGSREARAPIGNLIVSGHIADRAVKIGRVGVNFRSGHGGYSGINGITF